MTDGEGKPRKFNPHEQALVEEVLHHDGYQLLLQYLQAEAARTVNALTRRTTTWDDTNYHRGVLTGLQHFSANQVRRHYESEKP